METTAFPGSNMSIVQIEERIDPDNRTNKPKEVPPILISCNSAWYDVKPVSYVFGR